MSYFEAWFKTPIKFEFNGSGISLLKSNPDSSIMWEHDTEHLSWFEFYGIDTLVNQNNFAPGIIL